MTSLGEMRVTFIDLTSGINIYHLVNGRSGRLVGGHLLKNSQDVKMDADSVTHWFLSKFYIITEGHFFTI